MSTTTRVVRRLQAGFTLIELMVVMVIVGILASIGANIYSGHMRQANVSRAIPYLQNIAAKQRIHYNRTGRYLASGSETEIQSRLGVTLNDAGDFCFMTFCADSGTCGAYASGASSPTSSTFGSLVAVPSGTPAFQVIAVLRSGGSSDAAVSGAGQSCAVSLQTGSTTDYKASSGWVGTAGAKGGEGRVVVLTYPPVNGTNTVSIGSHASFPLDWSDGITLSDALVD